MNTEQILQMEAGRKLDAIVMEAVMGYRKEPREFLPEHHWAWVKPDCKPTYLLPQFSRDIAAAWEVHEAMRSDGLWVRFVQALCVVFLHDDVGRDLPYEHDESNWWLMATATAHQRSRAALLARRA